ncbi:hypothetical protein NX059_009795 [Plenodomus lindquistii]|nr:hypothetical protein NX059_009795 [Plenodomus lindquistii]
MSQENAPTPSTNDQAGTHGDRPPSNDPNAGPEPDSGSTRWALSGGERSVTPKDPPYVEARQAQQHNDNARRASLSTSIITGHMSSSVSSRTSLDDLQRWPHYRTWPTENLAAAAQSQLPPSLASSVTTISSASISEQVTDSLDQLNVLPPEDVALPSDEKSSDRNDNCESGETALSSDVSQSESMSSEQKSVKSIEPQMEPRLPPLLEQTEADHYREHINQLAKSLPNFNNVVTTTVRHQWSSRIVLHDRMQNSSIEITRRLEPWAERVSMPSYEEINYTLKNITEDCVQRVIIVEDLAPLLIQFLGATFQIPAHVFEEHLKDSGYDSTRTNWARAATWDTQSLAQGFFSITWYRAILPIVPITPRFRTKLITNQKVSVRCVDDECERNHNVRVKTAGNIWRQSLDLCAELGVDHKGSKTEYPVGWEERATIWSRKIGNCTFGMLE